MLKLVTITMYLLWICAITMGLVATFSDFKYEDVNLIALLLLVFTLLNTFFVISRNR